jgi:hypothetical protein
VAAAGPTCAWAPVPRALLLPARGMWAAPDAPPAAPDVVVLLPGSGGITRPQVCITRFRSSTLNGLTRNSAMPASRHLQHTMYQFNDCNGHRTIEAGMHLPMSRLH